MENPEPLGAEVARIRSGSEIQVDKLTIHVRELTIIQQAAESAPPAGARPIVNATLFLLFTVGLTIWYWLHLETYVTQKMIVGGITLLAVWKLIESTIELKRNAAGVRKRLLARPEATSYLILALVIVAALLASTSSIYVTLADKDTSRLRINVVDGDGRELVRLSASPESRLAGGPRFLQWRRARHVRFEVVDPPGYRGIRYETLYPWSHVALTFPDKHAFPAVRYTLLRVVPGITLEQELPHIDGRPNQYVLTARSRKGADLCRVDDYRFQTLYLGASAADLARVVPSLNGAEFERELNAYLTRQHVPQPYMAPFVTEWTSEARQAGSPELKAGDIVDVRITKTDATRCGLIATGSVAVSDRRPTTLVLEKKPCNE